MPDLQYIFCPKVLSQAGQNCACCWNIGFCVTPSCWNRRENCSRKTNYLYFLKRCERLVFWWSTVNSMVRFHLNYPDLHSKSQWHVAARMLWWLIFIIRESCNSVKSNAHACFHTDFCRLFSRKPSWGRYETHAASWASGICGHVPPCSHGRAEMVAERRQCQVWHSNCRGTSCFLQAHP